MSHPGQMHGSGITEAATPALEADIRRRLDGLAPCPPSGRVTALALAKHLAIRAQVAWSRQAVRGLGFDGYDADLTAALAAAARALAALESVPWPGQVLAQAAAQEIRDAWADGEGAGVLLEQLLGEQAADEVEHLAQMLAGIGAGNPQQPELHHEWPDSEAVTAEILAGICSTPWAGTRHDVVADIRASTEDGQLPGRELHCARDVADALTAYLAVVRGYPSAGAMLEIGAQLGVRPVDGMDVITDGDMPPGEWRIEEDGIIARSGRLAGTQQ